MRGWFRVARDHTEFCLSRGHSRIRWVGEVCCVCEYVLGRRTKVFVGALAAIVSRKISDMTEGLDAAEV
jgi:hypothetical protein